MKELLIIILFLQFNFLFSQDTLFVSARNGLVVRSQPNKNSKNLGKLPYAEKIIYYKNTGDFDEIVDNGKIIKGEWYHIIGNDRYSNKIEGYVFNKFLTFQALKKTLIYNEFNPKSTLNFELESFYITDVYKLDSLKVVNGYYEPKDGKIVLPDTENNFGHRLLMLNAQNKIIYQSEGFGEAYLFEPHFYKSNISEKVIIICQLGFEYYFGGELFILENGKIQYIGILDIESDNHEKSLTDIIIIKEINNEIIFSFNSKNLVLEPGTEDIHIKNKGTTYNYINGKLILKKETTANN